MPTHQKTPDETMHARPTSSCPQSQSKPTTFRPISEPPAPGVGSSSIRARVRRCRAKRARAGRTRVELYLDEKTLDAVERFATEEGQYRSATLTDLVITALCFEGRLSHPWFSPRIAEKIRGCFR
jgi:hypothetical protein